MAKEFAHSNPLAHTLQRRKPACSQTGKERLWRSKSRAYHLVAALVVGLLLPDAIATAASPLDETEASHLLRMAGHIEWPATAFARRDSAIVVGVVGSAGVYEALLRMAPGRLVDGRSMAVLQLDRPQANASVHLLYIGVEAWDTLPLWMSVYQDRPVVVATNAPQAVDRGATFGFVRTSHRVALEASLPAAEQSGVRLSSGVLRVADRVVGSQR